MMLVLGGPLLETAPLRVIHGIGCWLVPYGQRVHMTGNSQTSLLCVRCSVLLHFYVLSIFSRGKMQIFLSKLEVLNLAILQTLIRLQRTPPYVSILSTCYPLKLIDVQRETKRAGRVMIHLTCWAAFYLTHLRFWRLKKPAIMSSASRQGSLPLILN